MSPYRCALLVVGRRCACGKPVKLASRSGRCARCTNNQRVRVKLYRSRHGTGKQVAELISEEDAGVWLQMVGLRPGKPFWLPRVYWDSPTCGWRRASRMKG